MSTASEEKIKINLNLKKHLGTIMQPHIIIFNIYFWFVASEHYSPGYINASALLQT